MYSSFAKSVQCHAENCLAQRYAIKFLELILKEMSYIHSVRRFEIFNYYFGLWTEMVCMHHLFWKKANSNEYTTKSCQGFFYVEDKSFVWLGKKLKLKHDFFFSRTS